MSKLFRSTLLTGSVALLTTLVPGDAMAQGVMAQELWGAWQDGVAVAGGTLSAIESREGNQLVLSDLRLDMGEDGGVLQLEKVKLVNQADGSVGVILPDSFPLIFELPSSGGAAASDDAAPSPDKAFITVDAPQLNLIVRGLGERAEFQASAPELRLVLDRFSPPIPPEDGDVALNAVLTDFDLRYLQDLAADVPMLDGGLSFTTLAAEFSLTNAPRGDGRMTLRIGASEASVAGALPTASPAFALLRQGGDPNDPNLEAVVALIDAGLRANLSLSLGEMGFTGDIDIETGDPVRWDIGLQEAAIWLGLDAAKAGYSTGFKGARLLIEGDFPDVPTDLIELTLAEYRQALSIGLNGLRGPQEWSAAFVLRELGLSESLWDTLVPEGQLPRDPMTMALDFGGSYAVRPEALAPGWVPDADTLPFTGFSFDIKEMNLGMLGLRVVGQGGLTLNLADLTTFAGFPAPEGRVSVLTTGAYTLLDFLSATGQIPASELTGLRTALLMIGRAGEAPDTLHTDLDFRDKGFFLNGIRIR